MIRFQHKYMSGNLHCFRSHIFTQIFRNYLIYKLSPIQNFYHFNKMFIKKQRQLYKIFQGILLILKKGFK